MKQHDTADLAESVPRDMNLLHDVPDDSDYPLYTEKDQMIYRHTPFDLRCRGWMVAVHNDYTLNGTRMTFWLLTKGDRCVRGEGKTDLMALDRIRDQLRRQP